jgi:hypothetical protein
VTGDDLEPEGCFGERRVFSTSEVIEHLVPMTGDTKLLFGVGRGSVQNFLCERSLRICTSLRLLRCGSSLLPKVTDPYHNSYRSEGRRGVASARPMIFTFADRLPRPDHLRRIGINPPAHWHFAYDETKPTR